jgi:hypothetical protein
MRYDIHVGPGTSAGLLEGWGWPIRLSAHYMLNQLSLMLSVHMGTDWETNWLECGRKAKVPRAGVQDFRLGTPWFILGALGHGIFKTLNLLLRGFICGHAGDGGIVSTHYLDRKGPGV